MIPASDSRVDGAIALAQALRSGTQPAPQFMGAIRAFAIGDPQTSATRFFSALAIHGLLAPTGWLRPDVRLVALGDYFDYHVPEREAARVEGVLILTWLAAHAPAQVTVIAGNHDLSRVMELVSIDDARFREAADLARTIYELPDGDRGEATAEFRRKFPELATTGYAGRDYNAFTVEQRQLVQRLLLEGRFALAACERSPDGTRVLVNHAGVTFRELEQLGLRHDERDPDVLATALEARLAAAVAEVAADWRAGTPTPLSLAPLHVAGSAGLEGGGLLYHRPADPDRPGADSSWERDAHAPRRFDPRELPRGLVQVIGHTGHSKAWKELARWREPGMDGARGGLRTLQVAADASVTYRRGIHRGNPGDAIVWMIDPEMHYVATPADVAILELAPSSA